MSPNSNTSRWGYASRLAVTATVVALVGSLITYAPFVAASGGSIALSGVIWPLLLVCAASGVAVAVVDDRIRSDPPTGWDTDGPSRVIAPVAAGATAFTLANGLLMAIDVVRLGGGPESALNGFALGMFFPWVPALYAFGAVLATAALLIRLRSVRRARTAPTGFAQPVPRLHIPG